MLEETICATPGGGEDGKFFAAGIAGCIAGVEVLVEPDAEDADGHGVDPDCAAGRVWPTCVIEAGGVIGAAIVTGLGDAFGDVFAGAANIGAEAAGRREVPRSHHINPTMLPINSSATSPRLTRQRVRLMRTSMFSTDTYCPDQKSDQKLAAAMTGSSELLHRFGDDATGKAAQSLIGGEHTQRHIVVKHRQSIDDLLGKAQAA
jgi:hypothetical protein